MDLGGIYYKGMGIPQNFTETREWWELAAAQDLTIAAKWLGKAAAQGYTIRRN